MSLAIISLSALVIALLISCLSSVNIGILAIVLAWMVGVYIGHMTVEQVLAGFPSSLFLTLVALTLLFSQAQVNGTLDGVARRAVRLCRGNAGLIPAMFFVLTAALSSIGPGNIASTALMAPLAMAVASRNAISPFLMTLMVTNGASAGSLSPLAPTGATVNGIVAKMGLGDVAGTIYLNNLIVHALVALSGFVLFGGIALLRQPAAAAGIAAKGETLPQWGRSGASAAADTERTNVNSAQWLTLAVIAALVIASIFFKVNVGMAAFAGALILTFANATNDSDAIKQMPWQVILMVTGVTVLVALLEKTGGLDLSTSLLARVSTPKTSTLVAGFFTGLVSIYSSTTGVVLPALLPTVPGLVAQMGGGDQMAIISSMNSAGHLVDVSPLSTLGALCMAAVPAGTDTRRLFNQLMAWGISMSVVGPLICWILFGLMS